MIRLLSIMVLLLSLQTASAEPTLTGLWLTQDHDGVVKVSNCGASVCAEIAGMILDHPTDPTPVDYRGVSQCHLQLISDAKPVSHNLWKGHIVNPRNGSVYGVELRLDSNDNLALRGFLGIPLLGQTQTWTRYSGTLPDDCRLTAEAPVSDEKSILGSYMGSCVPRRDITRFISLCQRGKLPAHRLRTGTISFDQINEGFDRLSDGSVLRQILRPFD
jgi:uncharacterized protein (DUF2147 family)